MLAFGADPIGLFIFTADGHVSISIMRNPPNVAAPTTDPDPDVCIPEWFCAYFDTYDVDYQASTWVTHVRGGNIPAYLGTDQRRRFSIRGDRLIISESYEVGGKTMLGERVLVRELSQCFRQQARDVLRLCACLQVWPHVSVQARRDLLAGLQVRGLTVQRLTRAAR